MSLRKFYFAFTSILLIFLFSTGIVILNYLKAYSAKEALSPDGNVTDNLLKPFFIDKDPFNALILVGDKSEANTDTMMVVNYNPSTSEMNIMSIPRDTKVTLDNGKNVKINSLYVNRGGSTLLMKHLSNMLGIDIKYYVYLNLETFRKVIDLLGGVWIDVPIDLDYVDPVQNLHIHVKAGKQLMGGNKAEEYLRFRHPNGGYSKEMLQYYDGSDLKRIEAQQKFIKELVKQKANILYIHKLNSIIDTVFENLDTNISLSEVLKMVKTVKDFGPDKVALHTLPGYSMDASPWYYLYDKDQTKELVKENFYIK
ncbi:MAG TPA: LCP family protein [Clostridiales bacterium]|nr:LCP family protein [Clostridiales bacterium]